MSTWHNSRQLILYMIPSELLPKLRQFVDGEKQLLVLTGAGVSAESGIPTFRGPEGYWKVGSKNYKPQEIGTFRMFKENPGEVWRWYLFRRTVCQKAQPNPGHKAIVALEQLFGDRFTLITQNVDGLHLRAGNSLDRTFLVHGSLEYVRCSVSCTDELSPFPTEIGPKDRETPLTEADWAALACPNCGQLTRPHILWFDEFYNERHFRFRSSMAAAAGAGMLITVGTSGATNLPNLVVEMILRDGELMVDVNIEPNIFSHAALQSGNGYFLQGPSGEILPALVKELQQLLVKQQS